MNAHPFLVLAAILLVLVTPAMIGETSLRRFGFTLFVAAFGVMLPLFIFFFSAFLVPEWKGACRHGWIDCFHLGKFALAPLVFWATGALYAVEVCRVEPPYRRGVVLGLFTGVLVAGGCFLYGVIFLGGRMNAILLWLLVPLYVALWHAMLLVKAMKYSTLKPLTFVLTFLGSIPFWFWSVIWSRRVFESLPDKPPSCFVVTAAGRGHRKLVGPFVEFSHRGCPRFANQQLVTLWQFEALWRVCASRSHAVFRRGYNVIGPFVARRITSAWLADAAYVALKPVEWLAKIALGYAAKNRSTAFKSEGIHETN